MKAVTLSELRRWGNAHEFVFGFRRWEFLSFRFIFPSLMSLPPPLRRSQGVGVQSFSSRPESHSEDADVPSSPFSPRRWSKALSRIWVVEWRRIITADLPPNPPEMIDPPPPRQKLLILWPNVLLRMRFCL